MRCTNTDGTLLESCLMAGYLQHGLDPYTFFLNEGAYENSNCLRPLYTVGAV